MDKKQTFIIALLIISTAGGVVLISLIASIVMDVEMTEQGRKLLADIVQSMIVIVSVLIGSKSTKSNDSNKEL
jgi:hypothetical protein